jgi:hypothetical protein
MINRILFIFWELLKESPFILVCVGSIIAALVLWRRAPSASLFVVLGCGLSLVLAAMYPVVWEYFVAHGRRGDPAVRSAFTFAWSLVRSASTVLLVLAAYAGRQRSQSA